MESPVHDNDDSRNGNPKKIVLEELSREDLLKKCKWAISIAQKAKQAKSELQIENEKLTSEVEKCTIQRNADKHSIKTLQELVESLTEQKLNYITEIDAGSKKVTQLQQICKDREFQIEKLKADIIVKESNLSDSKLQLSDLDSQNVSYKRQMDRLQDENEHLLNQLAELESKAEEMNRLGLEQRQQLNLLEETVNQGKNQDNDAIETNIASLKQKVDELQEESLKSQQTAKQVEEKLREITNLYESEKLITEKASVRLRSYKDKIVKCSNCITQLKNSRYILLKTIKDYSESIPKWQSEILNLSQLLTNNYAEKVKQLNKTIENSEVNLKAKTDELDKCKNDNEILNTKIRELELNNSIESEKKESNDSFKLQIKALECEKLTLIQEKQQARDKLAELETKIGSYISEIEQLNAQLETTKKMHNSVQNENINLKIKLEHFKEVVDKSPTNDEWEKLKETNSALMIQNDTLHNLNGLLKEENETLKSVIERPLENDSDDLNESLQVDILKLEGKLAAYKQENSSLLQELKEYRPKLKELDSFKDDLDAANAKLDSYKTENSELLREMKEINQVLKERGETISKQQKAISEMESLLEKFEGDVRSSNEKNEKLESKTDEMQKHIDVMKREVDNYIHKLNNMTVERDEYAKTVEENKVTMKQLRDEIEKLKQNSVADQSMNDESMSTSTISRVEEHSRMKDLDESFEEKYSKLRIFAVKLKKRVSELQIQLASEQERNKSEEPVVLQKDIEQLKEVLQVKTKEIEELKQEIANSYKSEDYSNIIDQLKNEVESKNDEIKVLKLQLNEGTQSEHPKNEVDSRQMEEINQLKERLEILESELSAERAAHLSTKEELSSTKKSMKKKSVLSLEMEDYERSMKEMTLKMEDNKKKILQMESTIDTQQGTINSLKTQVKLLEDQVKTEENQHRLTKEELHRALGEVEEKDRLIQTKNEAILKLERELESLKQNQEEANIQMTSLLGEKEKNINSLFQEKLDLGQRLKKNEAVSNDLEEKLRAVNIELEDLKAEFTSYKVRAQAVLRQNQTVDHSLEETLKEENASLKGEVDSLKNKVQSNSIELNELRNHLAEERRKSADNSVAMTRATQRCRRLEAEALKLTEELNNSKNEHSLQVSTLTQCYKTQIAELESRHRKESEELKQQLAALKESIQTRESIKTASGESQAGRDEMSDMDMELNVSLLPREEGEGSEFAPSPPPSKNYSASGRRSPMPLERLLEEGIPEDDAVNMSVTLGLSVEQELSETKRKLHVQTQRCRHVTALLSESEREYARACQQNELLKAELRRASGNIERTAHVHNAEYIKNVTLKFLTLPPGDERMRLVPVLQKVLTLSPDETNNLSAVAKGIDANSNRGWGSYIPWPGGGGK